MKLFRVFPWNGRSRDNTFGGPLYVNRELQGGTRHGIPDLDGVLYTSTIAVSAIAEAIKDFRGRTLENEDLVLYGNRLSLGIFDLHDQIVLINLCDKNQLAHMDIDPIHIATKDRPVSQRMARQLHSNGAAGFLWWSSLEARWTNASLFESRVRDFITVQEPITPLSIEHPDLIDAARMIGVFLKKRKG